MSADADDPAERDRATVRGGTAALGGVKSGEAFDDAKNTLSSSQLQGRIVPASDIRYAIVDDESRQIGHVRAIPTRWFDVRSRGCTCHSESAPCLCCRAFHAGAVAREARMAGMR